MLLRAPWHLGILRVPTLLLNKRLFPGWAIYLEGEGNFGSEAFLRRWLAGGATNWFVRAVHEGTGDDADGDEGAEEGEADGDLTETGGDPISEAFAEAFAVALEADSRNIFAIFTQVLSQLLSKRPKPVGQSCGSPFHRLVRD